MSVIEFIHSLFVPPKPIHTFGMRVKVLRHGYHIGESGSCRLLIVSPVDALQQDKYGKEITILSDAVAKLYADGEEAFLPFEDNPNYDPRLIGSEKILVRVDLLGL